jgi:hypothetical protein
MGLLVTLLHAVSIAAAAGSVIRRGIGIHAQCYNSNKACSISTGPGMPGTPNCRCGDAVSRDVPYRMRYRANCSVAFFPQLLDHFHFGSPAHPTFRCVRSTCTVYARRALVRWAGVHDVCRAWLAWQLRTRPRSRSDTSCMTSSGRAAGRSSSTAVHTGNQASVDALFQHAALRCNRQRGERGAVRQRDGPHVGARAGARRHACLRRAPVSTHQYPRPYTPRTGQYCSTPPCHAPLRVCCSSLCSANSREYATRFPCADGMKARIMAGRVPLIMMCRGWNVAVSTP